MDIKHELNEVKSSLSDPNQEQPASSVQDHHGDQLNREEGDFKLEFKIKCEPFDADEWEKKVSTISGNLFSMNKFEEDSPYVKTENIHCATSDNEDGVTTSDNRDGHDDKQTSCTTEGNSHDFTSCCEVCTIDFDEQSEFIKHMFIIHSNFQSVSGSSEEDSDVNNMFPSGHEEAQPEKDGHVCKYCSETFKFSHVLTRHLYLLHNEEEMDASSESSKKNIFECKLCDKGFRDKKFNLKRHFLAVHNSVKKYRCVFERCGQVYKQEWELRRHQRANHAECSAFMCLQCGQRFTSTRNLRIHKKFKHEGSHAPNHICHLCEKGFHFPWRLKRHLEVVHSNKKPYNCKFKGCDKAFKEKSALKRHMIKVHDID